jgi:hypothetical protein
VVGDLLQASRVRGVAGEVAVHLGADPRIGAGVDVGGGGLESGQASGHVAGLETLGSPGEVGQRDEPAVALPEGLPRAVAAELTPDQLGVGHDRVGAEVLEVGGALGVRAGHRLGGEGGAATGPPLVEQEHPVGLQRVSQPAVGLGRPR